MDFKDCDGVDSVKDANAEAGRKPYDREGYYDAKRRGWLKEDWDEFDGYEPDFNDYLP